MADTYSQLPSVSSNVRDVMLEGGEPFALNSLREGMASQVSQTGSSAYNNFVKILTDLTKRYQQIGTAKFLEPELAAREQQSQRALAPLSPELAGAALSPSQIMGIKQAQVGALEPSISGARELRQTFSEQLQSFGSSLEQAKALGQWMQDTEQKEQDEYKDILFNFPSAIREMSDDELKAFSKKTGYSPDLVREIVERDTLQERQLQETIRHNKAMEGNGISSENINTTLYSVGLPYTIVSDKGQLTDTYLNKLQKVGIPPQDAQEIMNEILSGKSLEEIRQWMRSLGVDPKILDDFMNALQGEEDIKNPWE